MSRSYRKFPLYNGNTKRWGKQHTSRLIRHKTKDILRTVDAKPFMAEVDGELKSIGFIVLDNEDFLLPKPDEIYNFWYDNDGGWQFNPEKCPELMRK